MTELHVGTSAFTAAGWETSFYPKGMKPADYLSFYATKFETVELDNTFYRTPSISTVQGWNQKTPPGFIFAAKIPQGIMHEKVLVVCLDEHPARCNTYSAWGSLPGVSESAHSLSSAFVHQAFLP